MRRLAAALLVLAGAACAPSAAQAAPSCLTADPPPVTRPAHALRFGITPQAAGNVGTGQGTPAPEDPAKALGALGALRPPHRELVLRLNRLFWSDGAEGIRRFAATVDRYAAAGFTSEIQVRYHPPDGGEGDMDAWERYVRAAVRELGRRRAVVAFSVTNEANFPLSPNTSDGAYKGVVDAIVRGVVAARDELRRLGRPAVPVGFTVMWRASPDGDAKLWQQLEAKATPAFRTALSYVGVQVYPGLVWPPAPLPGRTAGREIVEALTLIRSCYMPMAHLGDGVALWVSENGYATNLGRTEDEQAANLDSTVRDLHTWSGQLGITDYRYFNLRDNTSDGSDLFDAVGLLRDDYSAKPAAAVFRGLAEALGTATPSKPAFTVTRGARRILVRGEVAPPCTGTVPVRIGAARRRARVRADCTFALTYRVARHHRARSVRVRVG